MKAPPPSFSQFYQTALRAHLDQNSTPDPKQIGEIDKQIRSSRVSMLSLVTLHERVLAMEILPHFPARKRATMIRKAGDFFAAVLAITCISKKSAQDVTRLQKMIISLSKRTVALASANCLLDLEIIERKKAEASLRKSRQDGIKSLKKSELLKEQLRGLSRQILSAQEEERKKISRELHDVVAQALMGINVRLAALKKEAAINAKGVNRNIAQTQKIITKSADIVHQFARELRPTALDDLGLIPALQSYLKEFTRHTGVRAHLVVFEGAEKISATKRIVLYRIAQEALTNVGSHAHATRVKVTIRRDEDHTRMEIQDDGKSFDVEQITRANGSKRLGLIGMRERVEMVGGYFAIESAPGKGTTVIVLIPQKPPGTRKSPGKPGKKPKASS